MKEIPNYNNYLITEDGIVYSKIRKRNLKPTKNNIGYTQYYLKRDDNKSRWMKAHRLVALTYISNPNKYPIVMHLDNDITNNHKDNLKWGTHKMNTAHAIECGRFNNMPKGNSHHMKGKHHSLGTRTLMGRAKQGEHHPKFKGYYTYQGITAPSFSEIARQLKTSTTNICRLFKRGLIQFTPKVVG
jgi:hypothetical protein